jgi:hypothetical protein
MQCLTVVDTGPEGFVTWRNGRVWTWIIFIWNCVIETRGDHEPVYGNECSAFIKSQQFPDWLGYSAVPKDCLTQVTVGLVCESKGEVVFCPVRYYLMKSHGGAFLTSA